MGVGTRQSRRRTQFPTHPRSLTPPSLFLDDSPNLVVNAGYIPKS